MTELCIGTFSDSCIFISFSCMGTVDRLEWALTLAGENRTELKRYFNTIKMIVLSIRQHAF